MIPRRLASEVLCVARRRSWSAANQFFRHANTRPMLAPPSALRHRLMSTAAAQSSPSRPIPLSEEIYHELADATMEVLLENFEILLDEEGKPGYEIEYLSGVLTLSLGDKGTYVINKQPPNKQIWLSSPFSGPKRYDYSPKHDDWRYARDDSSMGDLLNREIGEVFGRDVNVGLDDITQYIADIA
ncbi:Mitochondrial chaperone Frataxin [Pleurotus ostreatus]|uniref:ferroxidase n=1 Tax=Pleurotus ostreatus TaxID=5322 RepID=A0A8H7A366_PLEOS|nr:Mitochondrial chaperone Frataxin [Pleurotus ostreatus]KAF7437051.1 Mitochondrial chaperone Frataxin [Pleurotus ostreatus]KAJ8702893.1 Mitochondrial matrix iron chaperone [Pleurotus ostreatus]